jgi:MFS family permease
MIYAFAESVVIFCVVAMLGLIIPKHWEVDRRVAFLSLLVLITATWAMIGQLLFIWNVSLPPLLMQLVVQSDHPLRVLYTISLVIVIPTVVLPVLSFVRSQKTFASMKDLMERLSLLCMVYLFFDLAGLIIVLIRNLS